MKRTLLALSLLVAASPLVFAADLQTQAKSLFKPITKPIATKDKVLEVKQDLGKMLFFDPRLSKSQLISCNSCHNLGLGGADLQKTSVGHGWQKGPRNAPTVLNAGMQVAQFWDGRAPDLEAQAKGPVQAGVEMNNTPAQVETTLKSMPEYERMFKKAFPKDAEPVTFDNMAKAIAAFEATLVTPSSFDEYLQGNPKALTKAETKGLELFINKGCSTCHAGQNLGGQTYAKFGAVNAPSDAVRPASDLGRYNVTKKDADKYVFRVSILRNIELTAPYFHSGAVQSLEEAVKIMGKTQLGQDLTEDEVASIVTFLKSLTGKQPRETYPILPASTATTPQPVL